MSGGEVVENIGDNKEFAVATASDVTIYLTNSTNTSANDTATEKYLDNGLAVKTYQLRNNKTCQILSINGVAFTDPITSIVDKGVVEKTDSAIIFKMVIRTLEDNTNIKLRVRGR